MNRLTKVLAIAAAFALASCAGTASGPAAFGTETAAAAETFNACENVIYRASSADDRTALRCAQYLDAWR